MNFIRNHWYDIGSILGVVILIFLGIVHAELSNYQILMWLSLATLFFHQWEEYRIPGTFPGMVNSVMFKSALPDRYPLNSNTSFIINVWIGWTIYLLAAITSQRFVWLGMASILVSLGNIIAHTIIFNIKGKTFYNAGQATSLLFFIPCVYFFFKIVYQENLATIFDYLLGFSLGIIINVLGVFKLIGWLADKNTHFVFRNNQLLPYNRKSQKINS
ncbi:MAG: HXXEE domain-containing protein [Ferruginibacter sp.]|nr:HXXEE domain-containing protein [Ferruginibacter sp.]